MNFGGAKHSNYSAEVIGDWLILPLEFSTIFKLANVQMQNKDRSDLLR
jgi:hypothetical protein